MFAVLGRNDMHNSYNVNVFTSREAADLWAGDDALNVNDDWRIHEIRLVPMASIAFMNRPRPPIVLSRQAGRIR